MKKDNNKEVLVYWDCETIKEGGFYEDETGKEYQERPTSEIRLHIKKINNTEIEAEFEAQEGDFDYNNSIRMVTDLKGLMLFDRYKRTDNYNRMEQEAISKIKYGLWTKGDEQ